MLFLIVFGFLQPVTTLMLVCGLLSLNLCGILYHFTKYSTSVKAVLAGRDTLSDNLPARRKRRIHNPLVNPKDTVNVAQLMPIHGRADLKLVDASWFMPGAGRDPRREFEQSHIPGSVFFDIDEVVACSTPLPHMLPTPEQFSKALIPLGLSHEDWIVVYDRIGVFSAPRLWWMLRVFGYQRVSVLNGGFPAWQQAGGAVEQGDSRPQVSQGSVHQVSPNYQLLAGLDQVAEALEQGHPKVVDARSAKRFLGEEPEPREGLRSGHMPGALNIPFGMLLDGCYLRPAPDLHQLFLDQGIPEGETVITTCGSGITACVLALGLALTGRSAIVYDGSWAEWGSIHGGEVVSGLVQ